MITKRKINVLYVESGTTGGGSFESLYQHLKLIKNTGYRPHVVYLNESRYHGLCRRMGIPTFMVRDYAYDRRYQARHRHIIAYLLRMKMLVDLYVTSLSLPTEWAIHRCSMDGIAKVIKENDIQLVHTNNQVNRDLYAIECARKAGVPCVAHLRSFRSMGFNLRKARHADGWVSRYIAYSEAVAEHWVGLGINRSLVEVVYNGVEDFEVSTVNLYKRYNLPESCKIIGIVGSIIPVRGHEFLLKSVALLAKELKDVCLLVVGAGEERLVRELKALAGDLGIGGRTIFAGWSADAKGIIASLDVLVLPYSIEPFGRVLLEAWQVKTPVVLTRLGRIESIVREGVDGLLVRYGDAEELARKLSILLRNEEMRLSIAENGYRRCREEFSIQRHSRSIEGIYDRVLKERGAHFCLRKEGAACIS